jgi:16S rRNA (cytosine1402-N4)-methyltransferase
MAAMVETASAFSHATVLATEAVEAVVTNADGHYLDCTFGRGGHTRGMLAKLSAAGRVTGFDRDPQAVAAAASFDDPRFQIQHTAFSALSSMPDASLDGVLMDLGVSSPQIDDAARGFSFRTDGPLDMRMDTTSGQSVADWLLQADTKELEQVIRDYGEERFARGIAQAIEAHIRTQGRIDTTAQLAAIVARAVKTREAGKDPATRTFQALRIHINGELEELKAALDACLRVLKASGRLVVISFHSLEDRIVKQFIAKHSKELVDRHSPAWMLGQSQAMPLRSLGRVLPSDAEVARNPRARSAVMRVAERVGGAA